MNTISHIPFSEKDPYDIHVCKIIDLQYNLETIQRNVEYLFGYLEDVIILNMDKYSSRIYKILKKHNYIDINEDEFISLLREDG